MKFKVLFISIASCILMQYSWAEKISQNNEISLGQIIITPYKTPTSTFQSPASVDIISTEKANSEGVFTFDKAIEGIPSLYIKSSGTKGGDSSVFIRGAKSSHTQVLLDGIKLFDPQSTSSYFYAFDYMSLDNLEKIEITKGPYSTLYGSDSIGGTIQLLTRKGKGKPSFEYTQEFGSYQTAREKLSSQGEIGNLAYSLSVSRTDINHAYAARYKDGNHETDSYQGLNSSLRLDYKLSDAIDVGLISDYTYAKYEYDGWGTDDNDNYAYFYQGIGGINFEQQINEKLSHRTTLGYTRTHRKNWESASSDNWYNGKTYQVKWQGDYQLLDNDKLLFGFDYLREAGEDYSYSTRNPKKTANTKGYYIENIFSPAENLFLSAAFRLEDHSNFDTHNTFNVSGSYTFQPTSTTLKASFGEGFKAPSLYQLYNGTYGNPDLDPEKSESWEAGIVQKISKRLNLGITYFHTHIKDMINTVELAPWVYSDYLNVGKARIWGIENFLEYQFGQNNKVGVYYTHLDTEDKTDGSRLLYRPDNKLTAKLDVTIDKLTISPGFSYVGNRMASATKKLGSYLLANIATNYKLNQFLEFFVRLENILDYEYEVNDGYQTPNFSWYLGARYQF